MSVRRAELTYLHGDHLGSTSLTTDQDGNVASEQRYLPYGDPRQPDTAPTDFGFTAQRNEASFGLMDYNARYYSPLLGRFVSPDSIVPEPTSSGGFNRYRYARNSPLMFTDPTGHCEICKEIVTPLVTSYSEFVGPEATQATANIVNQVNDDTSKVFSNAPVSERIGPATRIGLGATAASVVIVEGGVIPIVYGHAGPLTTELAKTIGFACVDGNCSNEAEAASRVVEEFDSQFEQFSETPEGIEQFPEPNNWTDSSQPPEDGDEWEWRGASDENVGGRRGSWYNPNTGESLHPDLEHPDPIGPHYDYKDRDGNSWRIFEDGRREPKP